ncbi:hypothetical protein BH09MYX1_BH09MYX1_53210 [soil metagenome]
MMIWVLRENARAIRFYEIAGFRSDGGTNVEGSLAEVRMRLGGISPSV